MHLIKCEYDKYVFRFEENYQIQWRGGGRQCFYTIIITILQD